MALDRILRRFSACLAVLGVLGLAILPAEHMHSAQTGDGWHTEKVHRHVAAHHESEPTAHFDDDDHDGEAVWMDSSFIPPASAAYIYPVSDLLHQDPWIVQPLRANGRKVWTIPSRSHDPPGRPSYGLRAPPSLPI